MEMSKRTSLERNEDVADHGRLNVTRLSSAASFSTHQVKRQYEYQPLPLDSITYPESIGEPAPSTNLEERVKRIVLEVLEESRSRGPLSPQTRPTAVTSPPNINTQIFSPEDKRY